MNCIDIFNNFNARSGTGVACKHFAGINHGFPFKMKFLQNNARCESTLDGNQDYDVG